jgi:hypothetical protein
MSEDTTPQQGGDIPIHRTTLPEARTLNDLNSLNSDLQRVKSYLLLMLDPATNQDLVPAIFSADLIGYRRCFTSGLRWALSNADVEGSPHNAGWLHRELLAQADKLIAHSVNPFEETISGFMVREGKVVGTVVINNVMVNFHPDQTKLWGRLVEEIQTTILHPKMIVAEKALLGAGQKLPISEITKMPLLGKDTTAARADQRRDS